MATLREKLIQAGAAALLIQLNPDAALQKRIFADGFIPNSGEYVVKDGEIVYVGQHAEHLKTGEAREYYAKLGDWGNVKFERL
jgi:hypothetical protein